MEEKMTEGHRLPLLLARISKQFLSLYIYLVLSPFCPHSSHESESSGPISGTPDSMKIGFWLALKVGPPPGVQRWYASCIRGFQTGPTRTMSVAVRMKEKVP